ncbi:MAG: 3'-5' exonuclease [Verrucomicrobiia bacterium]
MSSELPSETPVQPAPPTLVERLGLPATISREEIALLPLTRFEGPIHLIQSNPEVGPAVEALLRETVLGVDTETRPSFRRGQFYLPSLLQAATDRAVFLFQLDKLDPARVLKPVFGEARVVKAGIAFTQDVKELQRLCPFSAENIVDLSVVARKAGLVHTGLRNMTGMFLKARVSKGAQVSDWSAPTLSKAQIEYAATDAWITRELYFRFAQLGLM